jgi:eukaryotic-like serine/threonine-protein kinase
MSLSSGTRFGAYEIRSPLGAGGMGEVYLATDTNLGREVAIKVLPASLGADADRLARFDREAKTLAAINHPNIATIYGLERADRSIALVMELIEGPTLADRIAQGPMPEDEALPIARQIAEALEAAHDRSIVHRDLKPANIKVRPDGTVKVLDFGLAKTMEAAGADVAATAGGLSLSPTIASPAMTQMGVLLGTAAYMSPEQARGKPVDKRTDIWAFGCVLYEMVTGRRAFGGDDVTETLAAIIKDQPVLNDVPAPLRTLIGRCLEKDPRQRLRDIGDAMSLVAIAGRSGHVPNVSRRRWLGVAGWAVAGVLLAALAIAERGQPATDGQIPAPVVRFQIQRELDVYNRTASAFAVSPNGLMLAHYMRGTDGPQTLVVRTLATGEVREVRGSATAVPTPNSLFWSHDSRQLVRGTASGAQVFDVSAGTVRQLCECRYVGGSWSEDGTILIGGLGLGDGISRLSPGERQPVAITKPDRAAGEQDTWPVFLPDGRRFLFTRTRATEAVTYLGALEGGTPARVTDGSARIVVSRAGGPTSLVAIDAAGVIALPFDVNAARVTGAATTLVASAVAASSSQDGVLATSGAGNRPRTVPTWFDRKGTSLGTAGQPAYIDGIALSSDGRKLARSETVLGTAGQTSTVWLEDVTSGSRSRMTFEGSGSTPVWSPTARTLAFTSVRDGLNLPYQRAADGTGGETPLFLYDGHGWVNDWSRDGQWVLISSPTRARIGNDLWVVPVVGPERKPLLYAGGAGIQQQAQFSPDGRFVAYGSDQSGAWEIYVQPFPTASDGKWLVASGGFEPRWSPDGTELFYFSGQTLMAVPVRVRPTFSAGTPMALFDAPILVNYTSDSHRWQVAPDGRRFLLLVDAGGSQAPPLDVIVNWPELLTK